MGLRGSGEGTHRDRGARARPAAARELRVGVHGRDRRGSLRWCNAGHGPPLLRRTGRPRLVATGLPLGVDAPHPYEQRERAFAAGDVLFAFTDGLVEARRAGEFFGTARLPALLAEHGLREDPQDLVTLVRREVQAWTPRLDDDVVILALRRCSS